MRSVEGAIAGPLRARLVDLLQDAVCLAAGSAAGTLASLQPYLPREFALQLERVTLVMAAAAGNAETYMATLSRVVHNLRTAGKVMLNSCPLSTIPRVSHVRQNAADAAECRQDAAIHQPLAAQVAALLADAAAAAAAATAAATNVTAAAAIKCPGCKTQDRIVRVLQQSRSADEGMATQCLCMACNRSWRLA
jgi:DNA-directed RNA polymerase subunit M/transcription elongation factor TFIIS